MKETNMTFGSVCSGIETASIAFSPSGFKPLWFSEIAKFPSMLLQSRYPDIPNYGDMRRLKEKLEQGMIEVPDLLCGGTPCNSYSMLGKRLGLQDQRGELSIVFTEIADSIDKERSKKGLDGCLVMWENVEGILSDKGNAFGHFLSFLTGYESLPKHTRQWTTAGIVYGKKRKAVWRVLDAAGFGLPQHRRRVFVLASSNPLDNVESVLFETGCVPPSESKSKRGYSSIIKKDGNKTVEVFSEYANCLYAAYGTKYNDRIANYGTLLVAENGRLRRLTPLECERLMGLPDNYTLIVGVKGDVPRYQALGNAWAVNVARWVAERFDMRHIKMDLTQYRPSALQNDDFGLILFDKSIRVGDAYLNTSPYPCYCVESSMFDVLEKKADSKYFLSIDICKGILRRKEESKARMNPRLESLIKTYIATTTGKDNTLLCGIGQRIRYYRKLNHLTQKKLADKVGLSERYIISVEAGKENISILNLKRIADVFGISLGTLADD